MMRFGRLVSVAAAVVACAWCSLAAENLVVNGDFESCTFKGPGYAQNATITNWTSSAAGLTTPSGTFLRTDIQAYDNTVWAFLKGVSHFKQDVKIATPGVYRLSFDYCLRDMNRAAASTFITLGDTQITNVVGDAGTASAKAVSHCVCDVVVLNAGTYTLKFNQTTSVDTSPAFDNIELRYSAPLVGVKVSGTPTTAGVVSPAYGFTAADAGTVLTCTAPELVEASADTRYRLDGWKLYAGGVIQDSGTSASVQVTAGDGVELVWQWTPVYRISASAIGEGTVSPTEQWVVPGETASVSAEVTSDPFAFWSGEGVTDANKKTTPLEFTVTKPGEVKALFGSVGDWKTGSWAALGKPSLSSLNVLKGLTPATSASWEVTDSGYNAAASTLSDALSASPYCGIKSNASLTYTLPTAKDLAEFRIWAVCGGTAHNGLNISSIVIKHSDDSTETLLNSSVSSEVDTGTYAILRQPDGLALAKDVKSLTFNFGTQKNGWCGYAELEALEFVSSGKGANLVTDGDFQSGSWTGTSQTESASDAEMPGWKPRNRAGLSRATDIYVAKGHKIVNDSVYGMLKAPGAYMSQTVTVSDPGTYRLAFDLTTRPNYCGQTDKVTFGDTIVYEEAVTTTDKPGYVIKRIVRDIVVATGGSYVLRFDCECANDTSSIYDNISLRLLKGSPALVVAGVPDAAGTVSPAYGTTVRTMDEVVTCTAPAKVDGASGDSRYECAGWELFCDGEKVGAGTGTSTDVTVSGAMRLVWKWNATYRITAVAGKGGSVSPTEQWIAMGEQATVTATPNGGSFAGWSGEGLSPAEQEMNPLVFTVTGAKTVTAGFGRLVTLRADGSGDFATLAEAVADMPTGGEIVLEPGTYAVTNLIKLLTPIRLRSSTGVAADVTLQADCTAENHAVLFLSNALARVSGVTIAGGVAYAQKNKVQLPYTPELLGGNVTIFDGEVRSCVIRDGQSVGDYSSNFVVASAGVAMLGGTLSDSLVCNNSNKQGTYGYAASGVSVNGVSAVVTNCVVCGNNTSQSYAEGGGIALRSGLVTHCVVTNNDCRGTGAGVYMRGGRLEWTLVADNKGALTQESRGSGLHANPASEMYIVNCTFAGNSGFHGGGVYQQNGSAIFRNCISFGNLDAGKDYLNGRPNIYNIQPASVSHCLFYGTSLGTASVNSDPCFEDAAHGDYRLKASSPAIGAGLGGVDLGCYAFEGPALSVATANTFPAKLAMALSFTLAPKGFDGAASVSWQIGSEVGSGTSVSFTPPAAGGYVLTAKADDGVSQVTVEYPFTVAPTEVYVSKEGTANAPYATAETAASSVLDALKFAADGTTVHVAAGDYDAGEEIVLVRAVTLVADEGPAKTSLYRSGAYCGGPSRRVLHVENAGAVVSGFTLTNGYGLVGYDLSLRSGTATNCVIGAGYGECACYVTTGKIYDSTVFDCTASDGRTYGIGLGLVSSGAKAEGCTIRDCHMTSAYYSGSMAYGGDGATFNRCIFRNNQTKGFRSGALMLGKGVVENSLFVANTNSYMGAGAFIFGNNGAVVRNCTFANNCGPNAGAIHFNGKSGTILNCLFNGNFAGKALLDYTDESKGTLMTNWLSADGDPQFRKGSPFYALRRTSPCCDTGTLYDGASELDLVGNPRVTNKKIDIGSCEVPPSLGLLIQVR